MRIVSFKTPKPKSFKYQPRYYDEKKFELEKKKAALGYNSSVTHNENLRLQMGKRWHYENVDNKKSTLSKVVTYLIYAVFIGGTVYFVMFTDIIDKLLSTFSIIK